MSVTEDGKDYTGAHGVASVRMRSGTYLDYLDPQPGQFTLGDIAVGLSREFRFNGQTEPAYSVAEHSCLCADQAYADGHGRTVALACLFHDAAEAFVGDVSRPLKNLLSGYSDVERRLTDVIAKKYGIDLEATKSIVKEIDVAMFFAEKRLLFSRDGQSWTGEQTSRVLSPPITGMPSDVAELVFLGYAAKFGLE